MRPQIEVLERMGQVVVHVRHQYGRTPNEAEEQTIVLDEHGATELCARVGELLAKRRAARVVAEKPVEAPERWFRVEARAGNGPRTCYALARTAREAHARSALSALHEAELRVDRMPEGFCPPNGAAKKTR